MTKKDLQEQIDRLNKRVADLEQRPQFVYIPQVTNIPYVPPIGGGITIGDPPPNIYPYITCGSTNQAPPDANVQCYNSDSALDSF